MAIQNSPNAVMGGSSSMSSKETRQPRGIFPPEVTNLLAPPLKVGAWSGTAGAFAGVAGAIATETSPVFAAILTGSNWFTLGTAFWFSRQMMVIKYGGERGMNRVENTAVSTLSGAIAGTAAGVLRSPSPRFILQNGLWFGLTGAAGQTAVNFYQSSASRAAEREGSLLDKLNPLQKLSDGEYEHYLEEKLLQVETEIALIDDRIAELRERKPVSQV